MHLKQPVECLKCTQDMKNQKRGTQRTSPATALATLSSLTLNPLRCGNDYCFVGSDGATSSLVSLSSGCASKYSVSASPDVGVGSLGSLHPERANSETNTSEKRELRDINNFFIQKTVISEGTSQELLIKSSDDEIMKMTKSQEVTHRT